MNNNLNNRNNEFNNNTVNNNAVNQYINSSIPNIENNNYINNNDINNLSNNININQVSKKNNKNKKLLVIAIVIILIITIFITLKGFSNDLGSAKNTTGLDEYKNSDVDYNCKYESSDEDTKLKIYLDFLYNYETDGNNGKKYLYQLKTYTKVIKEYKNGLTNALYMDFVDSFNSLKCIYPEDCTNNHLELGLTNKGFNTVIDRNGNKIEVTYYAIYGMGIKATKKDMKEIKQQYEQDGYICN